MFLRGPLIPLYEKTPGFPSTAWAPASPDDIKQESFDFPTASGPAGLMKTRIHNLYAVFRQKRAMIHSNDESEWHETGGPSDVLRSEPLAASGAVPKPRET